jgi:DNA transformation protein
MLSVLNDKALRPDDVILKKLLGNTWQYWEDIKDHLMISHCNVNESWKFYDENTGWVLQVLIKKQTLFWFKAYEGYFAVTFWFGDKAAIAAEKSKLSDELKERLRSSPKYKIGRSLTIDVETPEDVEHIKTLSALKVNKKSGDGLAALPNIGKDLSQKLHTLGINTPEELKVLGTERAYLQVKTLDPGACFSLLCAIEGAIQGIRWHSLSEDRKQELKQFFKMVHKEK